MRNDKDHIKAGIFVAGGLFLFFVSIFILSDFKSFTTRMQEVRVSYLLSDGVQGLKEGAAVTLGDQDVGTVLGIEDVIRNEGGQVRVTGKLVRIWIPENYNIYGDAIIELVPPLVGSGTKINIRSVGRVGPYTLDSTPIVGSIRGSGLADEMTESMGIGDTQRKQIRQIIANLQGVTRMLNKQSPALIQKATGMMTRAGPVIKELKGTSVQLKALLEKSNLALAHFNQRSQLWYDRVDTITGAAADTTQKIQKTVTTLNKIITDKDPKIRQSIDHIHGLVKQLEDKTLKNVDQIVLSSKAAVANLKQSAEEIKQLLVGQSPVIRRIIANAQLSSDQLSLAAVEIRRSPWRLLYSPSTSELETDNLYDAARSFAQAAGALDAATDSIKQIVTKSDIAKPRLEKMLKELQQLYAKYSIAETTFWDAIEKHKK